MTEYAVSLGIEDRTVIQSTEGYAFSQDSVLCANLMRAGTKDRVLDLGCGGGIMSVLLVLKKQVREVVCVDNDEYAVDLCKRNAELNGLAGRMQVVQCDVREFATGERAGTFDKVVCNPPYYAFDDGNADSRNCAAKREGVAVLEDFVACGARCLRFGGDFTLVHKADRLCDAVSLFRKYGLEPKTVTIVFSKPDSDADIFVMTARKGAKTGLTVHSLTVRDKDGRETERIKELYR